MKRGWKRLLALTLSALIMLPSVALTADAGDEQEEKSGVTVAIPVRNTFTVEPTEESTSYCIRREAGFQDHAKRGA